MDIVKRKEVEIFKDSFSYMCVEGKKQDKNIFFFMRQVLMLKLIYLSI